MWLSTPKQWASHRAKHSSDPTAQHWPSSFLSLLEGTHFPSRNLPWAFQPLSLWMSFTLVRFNNRREIVSKWSFFHHLPEEFQLFILNLDLHRLPIIFLVSLSPCDTLPKFPKQGYLHHSIILYSALGAGNYSCGINEAGSCRTPALFTSGKKSYQNKGII